MCVCILISRKPIKVDILKEALYCKAQANKTVFFNLIFFYFNIRGKLSKYVAVNNYSIFTTTERIVSNQMDLM